MIASVPVLAPIFLSSMLVALSLLPVMLRLQRHDGVRGWLASNLCMVAGLLLLALRGRWPDVLTLVAANGLLALAAALQYAGFAGFLGRTVPVRRLAAGVATVLLALVWWRYVSDNLPARVLVTSVFSGGLSAGCGWMLWSSRPESGSVHRYHGTALLCAVFAVAQFARGIHFVFLSPVPHDLMLATPVNIVLLSFGAAMIPVLNLASISLVLARRLARAEHDANVDYLTGALSRRKTMWLAGTHLASPAPVSVLLIDLDHFKRINDERGHDAGDRVLQAFVAEARLGLRGSDAIGRLGGEEFAILLPGTDLDGARILAERLREQAVRHVVRLPGGPCGYSISIGVAAREPGDDVDALLGRADQALYAAKRAGRNRVALQPA